MTPDSRAGLASAMAVPLTARSTISGMARSPTTTGTTSRRSRGQVEPSVYRKVPVRGSTPIAASINPIPPESRPFQHGRAPLPTGTGTLARQVPPVETPWPPET
jgi:hypothetical protein